MKTIISFLFISVILLSSFQDKEYSFVKDFNVSSPVNLSISTSGGNINAMGNEKNVIEVTFIVKKNNKLLNISFEELQKLAEIKIINETNNLQIKVKKTFERNVSISFDIKTPFKTSCNFQTSGGNIFATDITGKHDIKTSGGNITLEKITGNFEANTSGGDITIKNTDADFTTKTSGGDLKLENINGRTDISTSGGNIEIKQLKPSIIAQTSGGNINLTDVQGKIDLNTSGGSISMNNISGTINAITSGGNINADIIKLSEKLILKTSGGNINVNIPSGLGLDLDLEADKIITDLQNFSGTSKNDKIYGKMNGGGIQVQLSTSGGNITLSYK